HLARVEERRPLLDQAARDARAPRAAEERTVMQDRKIETKRGIKCRVLEAGQGAPVGFFHGAGGLLKEEPLLEALAARFHVFAPEWPGYGVDGGEEKIEDMLDFALHGWD